MEEFILPNRWYITVDNQEHALVYRSFFITKPESSGWKFDNNFIYGYDGKNYCAGPWLQEIEYTFITFKQFEEHVLNQKSTLEKEVKKENLNYLIDLFKELNIN